MLKLKLSFIATFGILMAGFMLSAIPASAEDMVANAEIENLKKRIKALEAQKPAPDQPEDQGIDLGQISKYLTLHGLLETEASYTKPSDSDEESDLTLATAELSIEATLNEFVGGHITLLYEEEEGEDDDIDVDEAVISLTSPGQLFGQTPSVHVGRMYVPFGMFNSYMISDPLTLELGETQDTAALFALEGDLWVIKAGFFNGDTDTDGDDNHIDNFVASFELMPTDNLAFGISYINDLAESDNELVQDATLYSSNVAAASAFLAAQYGQFGLEVEFLAALDDFDSELIAVGEDLTGKKPKAWNLELAWMPTERVQLAARYEEANDFQDDVKRYGMTASYGLFEHVVIALEYLRADSNADEDDKTDNLTAQLAMEF